jgi:hypothetical protein
MPDRPGNPGVALSGWGDTFSTARCAMVSLLVGEHEMTDLADAADRHGT